MPPSLTVAKPDSLGEQITGARGTEMYVVLWTRLFGALKTPMFNVKLVR